MPSRSELPYTAFLQYSPRGISDFSKRSRVLRDAIKNDSTIPIRLADGSIDSRRGIEFIVGLLVREMENHRFLRDCFGPDVALVPVPRNAPLSSKDALWPSRRICEALVSAGYGAEVAPLLKRKVAVQKSSTAEQGMRPDPETHYHSTVIDNSVPTLIERPLTLVDDIVTRGSSLMGMIKRLAESFPRRKLSCFALMHTVSIGELDKRNVPVQGVIIQHPSGKLWRDINISKQPSLGL